MQTEQVQQTRIETYTASLPGAIQGANGAQFAMLLSLITANQNIAPAPGFSVAGTAPVEVAQPAVPSYPTELEVNKPYLVDRLNQSVNNLRFGDFAYINSFIETNAEMVRPAQARADEFEKVALMSSGKLMLDHIEVARGSINLAA